MFVLDLEQALDATTVTTVADYQNLWLSPDDRYVLLRDVENCYWFAQLQPEVVTPRSIGCSDWVVPVW